EALQLLPNYIASNLRLLRKQHGWSQSELAEKVNMNRGNIASYESSSAEPSICKLLRISRLFGVGARDFTRRDFAQPGELDIARLAQSEQPRDDKTGISEFRDRALELGELVNSSKKLFEYKRSKLDNPCQEAELMAAQYQQLYEVTQQLLQEHRDLLGKVGCQCE
ncbi:MAG: helix-turn-helix transcriptional regulator, partial [Bacteroidota bacterium]